MAKSPSKVPRPKKVVVAPASALGSAFDKLNNWYTVVSTITGVISVTVIDWLFSLPGYNYLWLLGLTILVVLSAFALTPGKRWAFGILALYAFGLSYAGYDAYQRAQKYKIIYVNIRPGADPFFIEDGMKAIRIAIVFDNPNDFDVTARSHRLHVVIGNQASEDVGEDSTATLVKNARGMRITDLPITFLKPLKIDKPVEGSIDFAVCFAKGKDSDKFDQQFRIKGKFVLMTMGDALVVNGFRPAEPDGENFGFYDGCHR